ncbi:MAG TPA: GspH/FimT family pseudopilin [Steroidobacteraceae bacterium]|nr:GspH/FimT family pseudopilin [Steroidobacteraceae bacterium]
MQTRSHVRHGDGRAQRGFTLMELMVVLAVVGVIMGFAVPNFSLYIRNGRLTSAANDLLASVTMARTEAIKRQLPVGICATDNPNATPPVCSGATATAWRNGWVVWVDADNDWVPDNVANEPVLDRHPALDTTLTVRSNNSRRIRYLSTGFSSAAGPFGANTNNIAICDARGTQLTMAGVSSARALRITATGRPRVTKIQADVNAAIAAIGGACP